MPWLVSDPMSNRLAFVRAHQQGELSMTALCAQFGISRRVGYKWLARFAAAGPAGLVDQPRTPHSCPHQLPPEVAAALLAARQAHPTWGPRKLLPYLARRHPTWPWPAPSTVGTLLTRAGLIAAPRRRRRPGHPGAPTTPMDHPNAVWTVDFKGHFKTGDGRYCYPLTVVDGCSRYLLACDAFLAPRGGPTRATLERLFRTYGLPLRIRTDNGAPFASTGVARLSQLAVWWIRLGIRPELIEPAHPEQNGRHERLHRTLKAETTRPPAASQRSQHRRFQRFRAEYNDERPHEALGQWPPATVYRPSPRPYPAMLAPLTYPAHYEVRRVGDNGGLRWHRAWVGCGHALRGQSVGLTEVADGRWAVYFGPVRLGTLDERTRRITGNPAALPRARAGLLPMSPV